jgi:anthranilate synthase/aminodeoxychorismate synthase-like glutamine amidotransferase
MILLIDNYDSFTYNLYQLIGGLEKDVVVKENDRITVGDIQALHPDKIIISPGPGRPTDAGISMDIIRSFYTTIPILGVCLGHQCIGQVFGADVIYAKHVLHGKTSSIQHTGKGIFKNTANPLVVARYHSLAIEDCPSRFEVSAWAEDGEIMAIEHTQYPVYGIQFHPESFMTEDGDLIMRNFLAAR